MGSLTVSHVDTYVIPVINVGIVTRLRLFRRPFVIYFYYGTPDGVTCAMLFQCHEYLTSEEPMR